MFLKMYRSVGKRIFDFASSSAVVLVLSPFLGITALSIRLEDGGPALFRQRRIGRGGRNFTLLKFRSMPVQTQDVPSGQAQLVTITRVGRIIRRTNLDEIPQLLNILKGDMSVVGPRPALSSQDELLKIRRENGAMDCKPGLTGLAQINSYDGMSETQKAQWDGKYARSVSFLQDMKIILGTLRYLMKSPPVY